MAISANARKRVLGDRSECGSTGQSKSCLWPSLGHRGLNRQDARRVRWPVQDKPLPSAFQRLVTSVLGIGRWTSRALCWLYAATTLPLLPWLIYAWSELRPARPAGKVPVGQLPRWAFFGALRDVVTAEDGCVLNTPVAPPESAFFRSSVKRAAKYIGPQIMSRAVRQWVVFPQSGEIQRPSIWVDTSVVWPFAVPVNWVSPTKCSLPS